MRRAQEITDEAFRAILNFIRPGMTEREIAARLVYELLGRGGEKCHRTFDDDGGYGPDWVPLASEIARRGWSPTVICESAGTQAEDASIMKRIYQECLL